MLSKLTLSALATVAALGVSLLAPASASAFGNHGGGFSRGGGFGHGGSIHTSFRSPGFNRYPGFHHFPRYPRWHVGYRRPVWYGAPVVAAPIAYAVSRPIAAAPSACTCLTKEYTPDGRVMFKDRCLPIRLTHTPTRASVCP